MALPAGGLVDVGDIEFLRPRVRHGEPIGWLGIAFDTEPAGYMAITGIDPRGAAAGSGLVVGDLIEAVDGRDVRYDNRLFMTLIVVPPGTMVELGLKRGATVAITARGH